MIARAVADLPFVWALLFIVLLPAAITLFVPVLIRRGVSVERLMLNNEVAGFKFATLGALYAVLLAFVVVTVWEDFRGAEESSDREAAALLSIDTLASALPAERGAEIRASLSTYAQAVVRDEWSAMALDQRSRTTEISYRAMSRSVATFRAADESESLVHSAMLDALSDAGQHRRERLNRASVDIPEILWFTLLVGAVIVIGFVFFFGSRNVWAQSVQAAMVTALVCLVLLLVVSLDHPFTGPVSVGPSAFTEALETMTDAR